MVSQKEPFYLFRLSIYYWFPSFRGDDVWTPASAGVTGGISKLPKASFRFIQKNHGRAKIYLQIILLQFFYDILNLAAFHQLYKIIAQRCG
jgi:hypothetical protein